MTDTYTFEFTTYPGGKLRQHKRQVPLEDLLRKYDQAVQWKKNAASACTFSVYGPGLMRSAPCPATRRRIVNELLGRNPDGEVGSKRIIGLAWLSLDGSGEYTLHKVSTRMERWSGFEEKIKLHDLDQVDADKCKAALQWAKEKGWRDHGIWYRGMPALIFAPDVRPVQAAFQDMKATAQHLDAGQLQLAPVRYSVTQVSPPFPLIRTCRKSATIRKLRSRYPSVGHDLAYIPQEVLYRRYGASQKSSRVALAY